MMIFTFHRFFASRCLVVVAVILCIGAAKTYADAISDILVGFSASSAASDGGVNQMAANVYNQYAGANGIALASGSPHRQNVVGVMQSAIDCSGLTTDGGMANWLSSDDSHVSDLIAYGNSIGADQVTYIGDMSDDGSAAVAQQPGRYSCFQNAYFWYIIAAHESGGHNFNLDHNDAVTDPAKTVMLHNYCGGGAQPYYTNPNIYLNGVLLQGVGNCQGATSYGGDDCYEASTTAQGMSDTADRLVYGSSSSAVVYRWQFNRAAGPAAAGTIISDSVSGAQAVVRGQGAVFTGTSLRLPGGTSGNTAANSIAAYIDLPNNIFSAMPSFTVEIWAVPQSFQAWERVFESGLCSGSDGLGATGEITGAPGSAAPGSTSAVNDLTLTAAEGIDMNTQRFELRLNGTAFTQDSSLATTAGVLHHYAITFADTSTGGHVCWYRDGIIVYTLDVTLHSSQLQDVNNWLGRSMWSGDMLSNMDYLDLRIHNVALVAEQVFANYSMGPFNARSVMTQNDPYNTTSFNTGNSWPGGMAPVSGTDYDTGDCRLLTPFDAANHTFGGRSLTISGGGLFLAGSQSSTTTIGDLRMNGGTIRQLANGGGSNTQTLAGNLKVLSSGQVNALWGPVAITASISGSAGASMTYESNNVTLSANNSGYFGSTAIGDGRFSTVTISNESNLGGNPPAFNGAALYFDRGVLVTTQTMSISGSNRGICVGPSAGFFEPAAGTTLTIDVPISSPAAGNTIQTSPLVSNPTEGILFQNGQGVTIFTNPNNSHNAAMQILSGELRLSGSGRLNVGVHTYPILLNALFTDNSSLAQTLGGAISGSGLIVKGGTSTLTLTGYNTYSGGTTVTSGTVVVNNNSLGTGPLVLNGAGLSSTSNGGANYDPTILNAISIGSNGASITGGVGTALHVNGNIGGSGSLNLAGVFNGSGLTLGGTNAGYTGNIIVTGANTRLDSTAASSAAASWVINGNLQTDVSGGGVFQFGALSGSGTIDGHAANATTSISTLTVGALNTNTTFNGSIIDMPLNSTATGNLDTSSSNQLALTKVGSGTLTMNGANSYSGPTIVTAGVLNLLGTLSGTGVVTVSSGSITGTGSIGTGGISFGSSGHFLFSLTGNSAASGFLSTSGGISVSSGALADLNFNSAGSTVNFFNGYWTQSRTFTALASNGGSGSFALGTATNDSSGNSPTAYGTFGLSQGAAGVSITWTPKAFAAWRGANFGVNAGNSAISGFNSNPAGDGIANGTKYFYGMNPGVSGKSPLQQQIIGGSARLSFPRNAQATDVTAIIEGADSINGPWTSLAQSTAGAAFTGSISGVTVTESGSGATRSVQFTDIYQTSDPSHPRRFFRLILEQQ